jgi:signal transduction histidine kinase
LCKLTRRLRWVLGQDIQHMGFRLNSSLLTLALIFFAVSVRAAGLKDYVITNVATISELSVEEAEKAHPVRVSGVVTCVLSIGRFDFYIQQGGSGIYCTNIARDAPRLALGDLVELEGVTQPGGFARALRVTRIKRMQVSHLPVPLRLGIPEIKAGHWDSLYVEATGVVRAFFKDSTNRWRIEIVSGGQRLPAQFQGTLGLEPHPEIDSEVRIRGVVGVSANINRQLIQASLRVDGSQRLDVIRHAPKNPYSADARSIRDVMSFSSQMLPDRRVKVIGVLQHQTTEGHMYIKDDTGAAFVTGIRLPVVSVGQEMEVLGYPKPGGYAPSLEDAIARPSGRKLIPVAQRTNIQTMRRGVLDSQLVELDATVISQTQHSGEHLLVLQADGAVVHARLCKSGQNLDRWPSGSRIAATGICLSVLSVEDLRTGNWAAPAFEILLRKPADVRLLQPAPWWTIEKMMWVMSGMALLFFISAAWVWVLRQRVSYQTQIIAEKISKQSAAEERTRIARDMHDTVGARLTQLSLLHDIALTDSSLHPSTRETLTSAASGTHQVSVAMDEIVWSLNPRHDTIPSLLRYLARTAREYLEPLGIACLQELPGQTPERSVNSTARHAILSMVKECLQNIAKHAHATAVTFEVGLNDHQLHLCLTDNGNASVPTDDTGSQDGLQNLRERAATLGGSFELHTLSHGSQARITLPLDRLE